MIVINDVSDFNLTKTFECGQCFRWNADENGVYTGIAFGKVIKLTERDKNVSIFCSENDFENIWQNYFDLSLDYTKIRERLCVDDFMKAATAFGAGIRILKQDKWEALCSFIISQNNNIPRIKAIIENLCNAFGDKIIFEDKNYFSFPSPGKLAGLSIKDLVPLRCGYRANYILSAAQSVASGAIDLDALSALPPHEAKAALMKLHGVGAKVADCMLLFGLYMLDSFPRDTWIKQAISKYYSSDFDPAVFSPYAGIAQQYIFYYMRNA